MLEWEKLIRNNPSSYRFHKVYSSSKYLGKGYKPRLVSCFDNMRHTAEASYCLSREKKRTTSNIFSSKVLLQNNKRSTQIMWGKWLIFCKLRPRFSGRLLRSGWESVSWTLASRPWVVTEQSRRSTKDQDFICCDTGRLVWSDGLKKQFYAFSSHIVAFHSIKLW